MYKKRIFTRIYVRSDVKITLKSLSHTSGKHLPSLRKHRPALRESLFRDAIKPVPHTGAGFVFISYSTNGLLSDTLPSCSKLAYLQPESRLRGAKPFSSNSGEYSCMSRRRFPHNYAK